MDRQFLVQELTKLITPLLQENSAELVDMNLSHSGNRLILRFLIDKAEGGISLGECTLINEGLSRILDETDLIGGAYVLEVSSPGLDRPLTTKRDFLRCLNKEARFFFNERFNGAFELEGIIKKVEGEEVFVEANGQVIPVPLANIRKAKQIF